MATLKIYKHCLCRICIKDTGCILALVALVAFLGGGGAPGGI